MSVVKIEFMGSHLTVCQDESGKPWVALSSLCQNLGLDLESETARVQNTPWIAKWQASLKPDVLCISVFSVGPWLCTLDQSSLSDGQLAILLAYQCQAQQVLFDHFFARKNILSDRIDKLADQCSERFADCNARIERLERTPRRRSREQKEYVPPSHPLLADRAAFFGTILSSKIDVSGVNLQVDFILHDDQEYNQFGKSLEKFGIALVNSGPGPRQWSTGERTQLFFKVNAIIRHFFNSTGLHSDELVNFFRNIKGAKYTEKVLAGKRTHGWLIPYDAVFADKPLDPDISA